jgi:hypothetical protein
MCGVALIPAFFAVVAKALRADRTGADGTMLLREFWLGRAW